jgi:RNA polymerase sigma-70 factor (ECF subfamily)
VLRGNESYKSATTFEGHRGRLFGIAYRMLGSKADAEDIIQETYLRWHEADKDRIHTPEAWLVSVATRLSIDRLRSSAVQREAYVGPWLPEPLVGSPFPSLDEQIDLKSNISMAFMVLLERLAPEERAAFLLHDVFGSDYSEIAGMLEKTEASCRQIVHRARERLRRAHRRFEVTEEDRIRLVEKFSAAVEAQDENSLLALFAEDVTLTGDGGGKVPAATRIIRRPENITRLFIGLMRKFSGRVKLIRVLINGEPGLISYRDGKLLSALAFETDGEQILALYHVLNPEKLSAIRPAQISTSQGTVAQDEGTLA